MRIHSRRTCVVRGGAFVALAVAICFVLHAARAAGPVPVMLSPPRFEFVADPGQRVGAALTFWNRTDVALPIRVDAVDFRPDGEDGKIVIGQSLEAIYSLRDWVKFSTDATTVRAGTGVSLPFSISVSANATPGSRWAALRVTTAEVASDEGQSIKDEINATVLLRVRGAASESVALADFSSKPIEASGTVVFSARYRNEGGVHEKPEGLIRVYSMRGREVASVALPAQNVLPGAVRRVEATLRSPLGFGRYSAVLLAAYGSEGQSVSGRTTFWVISKGAWWMLVVLLLVCAVGGAMLAWRHVRPLITFDHHAP